MSKEHLLLLQKDGRIAALEKIVHWQTTWLTVLLSAQAASQRRTTLEVMVSLLRDQQKSTLHLAIANIPPEQSDLVAAEIQETFERVSKEIVDSVMKVA